MLWVLIRIASPRVFDDSLGIIFVISPMLLVLIRIASPRVFEDNLEIIFVISPKTYFVGTH